jgi:hypothetical protein
MRTAPRRNVTTRAVLILALVAVILLVVAGVQPFRSRGDETPTNEQAGQKIFLPVLFGPAPTSRYLRVEAEQGSLGSGWASRWSASASSCRYAANVSANSPFALTFDLPDADQLYLLVRVWAETAGTQMTVELNGTQVSTIRTSNSGWSWHRVAISSNQNLFSTVGRDQVRFVTPSTNMGVDAVEVANDASYTGSTSNCSRSSPPPSVFGLATKGELADSAQAQVIRNLRPNWVRSSLRWLDIEPENTTPDRYSWTAADQTILRALNTGATPLMLIWKNPSWAASTTCGRIDRTSLDEVGQFVGALVERYDGDGRADAPGSPIINVYEFYNEPDWTDTRQDWLGGCWGDHGADYAAFMRAAWTAAHAASPDVVILNGSLAAEEVGWNPNNNRPYFNFLFEGNDFFDDFLRAGGGNYLDGLNIHYFYAFHSHWDSFGGIDIIGKARYFQDQRLRPYGLQSLPLYASEVGVRSDAAQMIDGTPGSLQRQRDYVAKIFTRALSYNFKALTWFTATDDAQEHWGLLDINGQPKPSYRAFQTMTAELPGAQWAGPYTFPANVEGYRLQLGDGSYTFVLWSRSSDAALVSFSGSQIRVVQTEGETALIRDGAANDRDGIRDALVTISVTEAPVYVRVTEP